MASLSFAGKLQRLCLALDLVGAGMAIGIKDRERYIDPLLGPGWESVARAIVQRAAAPVWLASAFEDVVGNLVRNAIQTSVRQAPGQPVHIGFAVDTDVDFITGLEWLALRIRDRSPHELTVEMLRGRYIEEGLGLTADLVSRYDGALDVVEDAAPWTKAVVVRLPRVDDEDGGDDA